MASCLCSGLVGSLHNKFHRTLTASYFTQSLIISIVYSVCTGRKDSKCCFFKLCKLLLWMFCDEVSSVVHFLCQMFDTRDFFK